ncbi:2Fe-2S iron-sulfur cluster-binding family protein [Flavobacterium branchiicola]|uniref:2Fe-2S iron-sulfur cluster-binding protein n=1 Tax=Flavobacterium branchiicola TaxID=1114875 RepID=A0ABV9PIP2_9FLAO|nr:2Fe-2S iron-sulfur cluster-binding protein [Flavobacterium branchiicola]MBS7256634.1 2Fe-2S iron-sulfur cluster binding domain-containing protein [Flavobacterium branchiicola]
MITDKKKISFSISENNTVYTIETYTGQYPNLMFLLKDKLGLDDFGECGGVGRCATCVIKADGIKGNSLKKDRNEPATLSKMGFEQENIRLSCQLYITPDLEGCQIEILEL